MQIIQLDIVSSDVSLLEQLAQQNVTLDGVQALDKHIITTRSDEANQVLQIVLQLTAGVSTSILASWIYDKLKTKKVRLEIDRVQVDFSDEEQLKTFIAEKIKLSE